MKDSSAIAIIDALSDIRQACGRGEYTSAKVLAQWTGLRPATVTSYISLIRDEFGQCVIENKHGRGYRLGVWGEQTSGNVLA